MKTNKKSAEFQPNRVLSYFKAEWRALLIVTVSGLIYNIGLLTGPWFEGTMTGYLVEILNGTGQFSGMMMLVINFVRQPCEKKPCKFARRRRRQYHDEGHS